MMNICMKFNYTSASLCTVIMYYTVMLRFHIELCITGDTCMKFLNDGRFDMINLRKMFSRHVIFLKL